MGHTTTKLKKLKPLIAALAALLLFTAGAAVATTTDDADTDAEQMLADGLTELAVKAELLRKIGWDMIDVDVEVTGDRVKLDGEVAERSHQELAKEVALSIEGITKVDNHLRLEKDETSGETPVGDAVANAEMEVRDAVLESRVKTALLREMGTAGFDVEVEATDGEVSLRGTLTSENHEEIALETAEKVDGVDRVVDLIELEERSS
jgi:osmotically-inducible protein OsmY